MCVCVCVCVCVSVHVCILSFLSHDVISLRMHRNLLIEAVKQNCDALNECFSRDASVVRVVCTNILDKPTMEDFTDGSSISEKRQVNLEKLWPSLVQSLAQYPERMKVLCEHLPQDL